MCDSGAGLLLLCKHERFASFLVLPPPHSAGFLPFGGMSIFSIFGTPTNLLWKERRAVYCCPSHRMVALRHCGGESSHLTQHLLVSVSDLVLRIMLAPNPRSFNIFIFSPAIPPHSFIQSVRTCMIFVFLNSFGRRRCVRSARRKSVSTGIRRQWSPTASTTTPRARTSIR